MRGGSAILSGSIRSASVTLSDLVLVSHGHFNLSTLFILQDAFAAIARVRGRASAQHAHFAERGTQQGPKRLKTLSAQS